MTAAEIQRRKRRKLRARLVAQLGGKCRDCPKTTGLEFAHVRPTELSGPGRGQNERLYDVKRNPDCYTLLCGGCHWKFDNQRRAA
jgi:hypothetical protein